MAYIGRDIEYGVLEKQTLTADSSTVAFDLTYISDANGLIVSVGGIVQEPNVAYTVLGSTLTFTEAPTTGDTVFVVYLGQEMTVSSVIPQDAIDYQVMTGNGSNTLVLNHSVTNAEDLLVTYNGVNQKPGTDYTVSGTTLTFTTTPPTGMKVLVYFMALAGNTLWDGSVTNPKIVSMDASKLTGSMPSSVSEASFAPQYQDLSTLALHWASVDNKVAMNLTDDFIDHFQDSTGVVSYNGAAAVMSSAGYITSDRTSDITVTANFSVDTGQNIQNYVNGDTTTYNNANSWYFGGSVTTIIGLWIKFDFISATTITENKFYSSTSATNSGTWQWQVSNDDSTWTDIGSTFLLSGVQQTVTSLNGNTNSYRYYRMLGVSGAFANPYQSEVQFNHAAAVVTSAVPNTGSVNALVSSDEYVTSASELDTATNIAPSSNDWDYLGVMTASGNTLGNHTVGGSVGAVQNQEALSSLHTFDGDFVIAFDLTKRSHLAFGVHAIDEDDTRNNNDNCGMYSMTNSFWWGIDYTTGTQAKISSGDDGAITAPAEGSAIIIRRESGTITLEDDGSVIHTYSSTYSGIMRFAVANAASPYDAALDNIFFTDTEKVQRDGFYNESVTTSSALGNYASGAIHVARRWKATRTGTLASLSFFARTASTPSNFHAELWTDDGTNPVAQVGGITNTLLINSSGKKTFTFSTEPTVTKGQSYWAVIEDEDHASTNANVALWEHPIADIQDSGAGFNDTVTSITASSSAVYAMEAVINATEEPTPDHDTLLLVQSDTTNGSQTFVDSSQNARTVTALGDSQHSTAQSKFGASSMLFDGTGDYLSVPDSADWDFSGNFTVDCHIRINATGTAGLVSKVSSFAAWSGWSWSVWVDGTTVNFQVSNNGGGGLAIASSALSTSTWYHIAAVRLGDRFDLYVDGVSVANTTAAYPIVQTAQPVLIGRVDASDGYYFNGWIDEVRISNVARWDADFTPPTAAYGTSTNTTLSATGTLISTASTADSTVSKASGVMLYKDSVGTNTIGTDLKAYFSSDNGSNWTEAASYGSPTTFDGTTKVIPLGETTMSNTGTAIKLKAEWANQVATVPATGTTKVISPIGDANFSSSKVKIGNSSIKFDGTGDYLTVADSSDFNFGSGDFTIEYWINESVGGIDNRHMGRNMTTSNGGFLLGGYSGGSNDLAYFSSNGSSHDIKSGMSLGNRVVNGWSHIAVVRNGNVFTSYRDGISADTFTSSAALYNGSGDLAIGAYQNSTNSLNGYMDEIRLSNVARYTANFTPSTTAFTSDANTKLLIHSDESSESTTFTDSSSSTHTVTATGDAKHQPPVKKIGTSSLYCDGVGDLISVGDSDDFAFAGDYTVEFWSYFVGTPPNNAHCWGQGGNVAGNFAFMCRSEGGGTFIFGTSNGSTQRHINPGIDLSDAWHHIAMVKSGTSQKLYIDGTQRGSVLTHSDPVQNVSAPWEFGGNSNQSSYIEAYFDEIRFSDSARYTANFTPSTTAFTTDANTKLLIHGDSLNPQTQVGQAVGTVIGDMDIAYGANTFSSAAAFDGITVSSNNTNSTLCSTDTGVGQAYVGKDWGSGVTKTISGVKLYGSGGEGYAGGNGTSTMTLMGSNTAPTNASDGTELGSFADIPDQNNINAQSKMGGFTTTTPYRYHWVRNVFTGGDRAFFAEVEFYEGDTPTDSSRAPEVIGKVAQLHGWAVNY